MHVVVGLGNPGAAYATSRHNVGFMVVERLAARWRIPLGLEDRAVRCGTGNVSGQATLLVQPLLFMNLSGDALSKLPMDWANVRMTAIYDDIDLPLGRLRLRRGGGPGGHRGVASLIERFGATFDRVRIGVGRPPVGVEAAEHVLRPLSAVEIATFDEPLERACDAVECILANGIEAAMSRFNGRMAVDAGAKEAGNGDDDDEKV
jgi:PTH1 family peptidyl-tRNA hydrolase